MTTEDTIFLWDAGSASGTAGDLEAAFDRAGGYLAGGTQGLVEEAVIEMLPSGAAGCVSEYRRTGRKWRGRLAGGVPVWEEQAAEPESAGTRSFG